MYPAQQNNFIIQKFNFRKTTLSYTSIGSLRRGKLDVQLLHPYLIKFFVFFQTDLFDGFYTISLFIENMVLQEEIISLIHKLLFNACIISKCH